MSQDNYQKKTGANRNDRETEGDSGKGGKGGKGGQVEFREFIAGGENLRDDLLPEDEKKRLLVVHKGTHEVGVKKQKNLRDERQALKEGKISLQSFREGLNRGGINAMYKANPLLADKAQFSGVDKQVSALPDENNAETNNEKREELQYQYQLRYAPENAPLLRHTFKPTPYR